MILFILLLAGVCLGSFVNALVWRLRQIELRAKSLELRKKKSVPSQELSIWSGRSMCPNCRHQLAAKDLVPVFSWLALHGKCRYCHKPISAQYPLVELATAAVFVSSYIFWPHTIHYPLSTIHFLLWLAIAVGLVALLIYDLKWLILPNQIILPLIVLAAIHAGLIFSQSNQPLGNWLLALGLSLAVSSGVFYLLFQLSKGQWIGGGDVKLGFVFGLLLADPVRSGLVLFLAGSLGTVLLLPGLATRKIGLKTKVPFGPLLIAATSITYIWGDRLVSWSLDRLILAY